MRKISDKSSAERALTCWFMIELCLVRGHGLASKRFNLFYTGIIISGREMIWNYVLDVATFIVTPCCYLEIEMLPVDGVIRRCAVSGSHTANAGGGSSIFKRYGGHHVSFIE